MADAINIPASRNIDKTTDTIDTNTILFLYCTTESRSSWIATKLYQRGFREIYLLKGGIALEKRGISNEKRQTQTKNKK